MYFSYTSFSDINYRLYPSLSCGPRRDGGRSANDEGGNTLSATLCARWCVSKDEPLFLFSFFSPWFSSAEQVLSCGCASVYACVHGAFVYTAWSEKKRIYQRVSAVGVESNEAVCLRARVRPCSRVCVFKSRSEREKRKN